MGATCRSLTCVPLHAQRTGCIWGQVRGVWTRSTSPLCAEVAKFRFSVDRGGTFTDVFAEVREVLYCYH